MSLVVQLGMAGMASSGSGGPLLSGLDFLELIFETWEWGSLELRRASCPTSKLDAGAYRNADICAKGQSDNMRATNLLICFQAFHPLYRGYLVKCSLRTNPMQAQRRMRIS